jgi:hypothetical protein
MMFRAYLTIAFLWLGLGALAVDIELFKTDAHCDYDDIDFCVNVAEGACCGSLDRLYLSCQALGRAVQAYSSRPASGEICYYLLGGSSECWGVSNDINSISGCKWLPNRKRSTSMRTKRMGLEESKECVQPTHSGKRIDGKKYGIDMSRPEFEEYRNLTGVEEKNKFLVEHADIIRDE